MENLLSKLCKSKIDLTKFFFSLQKMNCSICNYEPATMGWREIDCCAECFWDRDAEEKKARRSDPKWKYNRAFAAAKVLFNKTDEEAHKIAQKIAETASQTK